MPYEYYVSTKEEKEKAHAWLFAAQADKEREKSSATPKKKRTGKADSIITQYRK